MLLSMLGDDVNETIACTLAACHARAGDFANAQRLQEWACKELPPAMLHDLERYRMQLALYGKRQPYTETGNPADGWVPAAETWPNGAKKATGMTYFGARIGPWHFYSDKGVETALCNYYEGKPDAACRSFYPNGTIAVEGFLVDAGKRIGRWRTWHENGMLESVGCYNHVDDGPDQRTGEWIWIDAQGKRREAGFFLNGKREGNWLAWDEQGKLLSRTHFAHGRPEAAWAGTANPPEPPSPAPVDVVKKQPEKGDDNF
jgi:antitoxin component YwqK of YwqJK toxin-antitoxin module